MMQQTRVKVVDWAQWETLLAIFRGGTYSKAAKTLRVDSTTVGRRLKLLEKHLGHPLFLRQDGRLVPTHLCESLLLHIETASESLRAAERESAASESGQVQRILRMTAPPFLIKNLFAPGVALLTREHRIRIELLGTSSNVSLSRREADMAVRIVDQPPNPKGQTEHIESEQIGVVDYAAYCGIDVDSATLPWAGLMEEHVRTTGSEVMRSLAGSAGFQYRAYHFDVLKEIAVSGVARTMLPTFMAVNDSRLRCVSDTVLTQPLWMLYHQQDRDVYYLAAARAWVKALTLDNLSIQK